MYLHNYAVGSPIHNSQKTETAQMSTNWWQDEWTVVYLYSGILFSHKKWSSDSQYNMDEPQKHYALWKKSDTKDYTVYDSTYIKRAE